MVSYTVDRVRSAWGLGSPRLKREMGRMDTPEAIRQSTPSGKQSTRVCFLCSSTPVNVDINNPKLMRKMPANNMFFSFVFLGGVRRTQIVKRTVLEYGLV